MRATYIIILILLSSCGTRKVAQSVSSIKADSSYAKTERLDLIKHTLNFTQDCETVVEAADTSKPFTIDGKQYRNVKIRKVKKVKASKGSVVDKSVRKERAVVRSTDRVKSKTSSNDNKVSLWIGGFFVLALLIYFVIDKLLKR
jgi:hypothetical protein